MISLDDIETREPESEATLNTIRLLRKLHERKKVGELLV